MPEQILNILPQLGPTVLVAIVAIWALLEVIKSKKNNKGDNGNVLKAIQIMEENHLSGLDQKIDKLDDKMDKIIILLTVIKEKVDKGR